MLFCITPSIQTTGLSSGQMPPNRLGISNRFKLIKICFILILLSRYHRTGAIIVVCEVSIRPMLTQEMTIEEVLGNLSCTGVECLDEDGHLCNLFKNYRLMYCIPHIMSPSKHPMEGREGCWNLIRTD